jgi:hypothetical protein
MHLARSHNEVDALDGYLTAEVLRDLRHLEGYKPRRI